MSVPIPIQTKQMFLHWIIDNLIVTNHDLGWFLQELIDNEQALHHVHFVDDVSDCPKGIIITSYLNQQIFFQFFKGNVQSDDVYTAYHEMNLYREESIYIQVTFPFYNQHKLYQDVIEDDVLLQPDIEAITDEMFNYILRQGRHALLMEKIDQALENYNYKQFIYYSSQLKTLRLKQFI